MLVAEGVHRLVQLELGGWVLAVLLEVGDGGNLAVVQLGAALLGL